MITGIVTDPRDLEGLNIIQPESYEVDEFDVDDSMMIAPLENGGDVEIIRGPNISKPPAGTKMPENIITETPISLWNLALEIHTGRIFSFLLSGFYILIVPLTGITSVIVILSGYLLWRKKKKALKN